MEGCSVDISWHKLELDPCVLVLIAELAEIDRLLGQPRVCRIKLAGYCHRNHESVILSWHLLQDLASVVLSLQAHTHAPAPHIDHILEAQEPLGDHV